MDGTVRLARAEDAQDLLELVRTSYDGSYPELSGGVDALARRLALGDVGYAIAFDQVERHIGQVALESRRPGLWEHGRAIVDPRARGHGLLARMSQVLFEEWAPRHGVKFAYGRSVTNHLRTQRYNESAGFVTLGLLLGVWEPKLRVVGLPSAVQPISALLVGKSFEATPRARALTLEGPELARACAVLDGFGAPVRDPGSARARARTCGGLSVQREVDQHGRLVHLSLSSRPGPRVDDDVVERNTTRETGLVWADVPAEHPAAPAAIEQLRDQGLSWGAYLPRGGLDGEDVVRLQRYLDPRPLSPEAVQVLESARALRDDVFAEALGVLETAA